MTPEEYNEFERQLKSMFERHQALVADAAYEDGGMIPLKDHRLFPIKTYTPGFDALQAAIRPELDAPGLSPENLMAMTRMVALELISRYKFPEVGGAQNEGTLFGDNSSESENPDILEGADEPAPEPVVVTIKVPAPEEES